MTADVVALPLAELRQRTSEKWREYPEGVLPLFVAETDFALAPEITKALGAEGAGHVRLNFGTSPEIITEAVARMGALRVGARAGHPTSEAEA